MDKRWDFDEERIASSIKKPLQVSPQKRKTAFELEYCAYEAFRCNQLPRHLLKQLSYLKKHGYDEFVELYFSSKRELLTDFIERLSVKFDDFSVLNYSTGDIFHVQQFFINIYGWRFDHYWVVQNAIGVVGLVYCDNLRLLGGKQMLRGERMLCKSIADTGRATVLEIDFPLPTAAQTPEKLVVRKSLDSYYSPVKRQNSNVHVRSPQRSALFQDEVITNRLQQTDLFKTPLRISGFQDEIISSQLSSSSCDSPLSGQVVIPPNNNNQQVEESTFVYSKTLPPYIDNFKLDLYRVRIKYYGSHRQKKGVTISCALFNSYQAAVDGGELIRDTLELFGPKEFEKLRKLLLNECCTENFSAKVNDKMKSSMKTEPAKKFRRDLVKLYPFHTPQSSESLDREAVIALGHRLKYDHGNSSRKIGHSLETRKVLQKELALLCVSSHISNGNDLKRVLLYSHRVCESHEELSNLFHALTDVEGEHLLYKIGSSDSTVHQFLRLLYANNQSILPNVLTHSFFDYLWFFANSELIM